MIDDGSAGERWRPSADLGSLRRRAELNATVRSFFRARGVMEVETPLLGRYGAMDARIASFECGRGDRRRFLQTSPEYAMKRLLAAGSGPIYQLCKAFRDDEQGSLHNPEFTMLEWYRPGFSAARLIDEVLELLVEVLGEQRPVRRFGYLEAFGRTLQLHPLQAPLDALREEAQARQLDRRCAATSDRDELLDFLFSTAIQPDLAANGIVVITDFPASQAALARKLPGDDLLADRFEVYVDGLELANGYRELLDADELQRRYAIDAETRRRSGLADVPMDSRLLAAMQVGLPDCSGVALGMDRLLLLASGARRLEQVLAFAFDRA